MINSIQNSCKVCGEAARGKHFGALVCRACAAFFRRSAGSRIQKTCKNGKVCTSFKKGCFTCKYCRLQKCFSVGMTSENFQFERDGHIKIDKKIPPTMDTFCGRSNFIIFCAPELTESTSSRSYINLQFLVDEVSNVFQQGPSTPVCAKNGLQKLSLGLRQVAQASPREELKEFGLSEAVSHLQNGISKISKWLTYFDEFQKLPQHLQLQMLQGTWTIWSRLENLASTARNIRSNSDEETLRKMEKDAVILKLDPVKLDTKWLSKYSLEEIKFFLDIPTEIRLDDLARAMIELDPSDVELSFMLGQLCFHYVGKRFQGEILQVVEKFQEVLADDLHDYYVNQLKHPYYMKRLNQMMKINNQIQREVYKHREKAELAIVFEIFCVDVSHPDMFLL